MRTPGATPTDTKTLNDLPQALTRNESFRCKNDFVEEHWFSPDRNHGPREQFHSEACRIHYHNRLSGAQRAAEKRALHNPRPILVYCAGVAVALPRLKLQPAFLDQWQTTPAERERQTFRAIEDLEHLFLSSGPGARNLRERVRHESIRLANAFDIAPLNPAATRVATARIMGLLLSAGIERGTLRPSDHDLLCRYANVSAAFWHADGNGPNYQRSLLLCGLAYALRRPSKSAQHRFELAWTLSKNMTIDDCGRALFRYHVGARLLRYASNPPIQHEIDCLADQFATLQIDHCLESAGYMSRTKHFRAAQEFLDQSERLISAAPRSSYLNLRLEKARVWCLIERGAFKEAKTEIHNSYKLAYKVYRHGFYADDVDQWDQLFANKGLPLRVPDLPAADHWNSFAPGLPFYFDSSNR